MKQYWIFAVVWYVLKLVVIHLTEIKVSLTIKVNIAHVVAVDLFANDHIPVSMLLDVPLEVISWFSLDSTYVKVAREIVLLVFEFNLTVQLMMQSANERITKRIVLIIIPDARSIWKRYGSESLYV